MKKMLSFLLLLLPILAIAQPKVKSLKYYEYDINQGWFPSGVTDYTYNEFGQTTSVVSYSLRAGKYIYAAQYNDYDGNGQSIRKRNYSRSEEKKDTFLYTQNDYEVGVDGCISSEFYRGFLENGSLDYSFHHNQFHGPGCRLDSLVGFRCDSIGGKLECEQLFYVANKYDGSGNLVVQHYADWSQAIGGFVRMDSSAVWDYNDAGQLVEQTIKTSNGLSSRFLYTYHPDGKLATTMVLNLDSMGWNLSRHDSVGYDYTYDTNGFVIEKKVTYVDLISSFIYSTDHFYVNYCDGLPRTEFQGGQKTVYEYTEGIDCDTTAQNELLTVMPNPASNYFIINYKGLERGKTLVTLHNAVGSKLENYRIWYRTDEVEVDVSQLPIGIYFLKIAEGKRVIGRKLVVSR